MNGKNMWLCYMTHITVKLNMVVVDSQKRGASVI
jgi:hypothetical protein